MWRFPSSLTAPCSSWVGISCAPLSYSNCTIDGIALPHRRLDGTLTSSLVLLSSLTKLDLSFNFVRGSLPDILPISLISLNFSSNSFRGTIPSSFGILSNLVELLLDRCFLQGGFPASFNNWVNLKTLVLSHNSFDESIPNNIGELVSLEHLDCAENSFGENIPLSIGALSNLMFLDFTNNRLVSSLPSTLYSLTKLQTLIFNSNHLTGSILSDISKLQDLILLSLDNNHLSGVLPEALITIGSLAYIGFSQNELHGTIPDGYYMLPMIEELILASNSFYGKLPTSMSRSLIYLDLSNNYLDGSLPNCLSTLIVLQELTLFSNSFTGSLPSYISHLSFMRYLYLNNNNFEGSIPSGVVNKLMREVALSSNYLWGPVPDSLYEISSLTQLLLTSNFLSGTLPSIVVFHHSIELLDFSLNLFSQSIPSIYFEFPVLIDLHVSFNYFTGCIDYQNLTLDTNIQVISVSSNYLSSTLPLYFGQLSFVREFYIDNNLFSGPFPPSILAIKRIVSMNISTNRFTGAIELPYFDPLGIENTANSSLLFADFSQNIFTGSIPMFFFNYYPHLVQLSLSANCFSGSISSLICNTGGMVTLLMDDLAAGSFCHRSYTDQAFHSYGLMEGSIPACIWNVKSLKTLHLSGNGLSGVLGDIDSMIVLSDLTVSSNRLTGTIPPSFTNHDIFTQLILSNNRLTGTLDEGFLVTSNVTNLNLSSNRFSGRIPPSFLFLHSMDVVTGNLFGCITPPSNDISRDSYVCGSDDLDSSALIFAVIFVSAGILLFLIARNIRLPFFWLQALEYENFYVLSYVKKMMRISFVLVCLSLVCLLFFSVLKIEDKIDLVYSTHAVQYLWISTIAFLHGVVPTIFCMFFAMLALAVVIFRVFHFQKKEDAPEKASLDISRVVSFHSYLPLLLQIINIVVIVFINAIYVYLVVSNYNSSLLSIAQIFIASFKVIWCLTFVPWMSNRISKSRSRLSSLRVELFANIFNFLLCPALVSVFTDVNCLLNSIDGLPSVGVSYYGLTDVCRSITFNVRLSDFTELVCRLESVLVSQNFNSPWLYSYQCGSSILVNYIPIMFYSYLLIGVVIPLIKVALLLLPGNILLKINPSLSAKLSGFMFFVFDLNWQAQCEPVVFVDNSFVTNDSMSESLDRASFGMTTASTVSATSATSATSTTNVLSSNTTISPSGASKQPNDAIPTWMLSLFAHYPLVRTDGIITQFLRNIVVLLTYGMGCPLFALTVGWTALVEWIVLRLQVGCYISNMKDAGLTTVSRFRLEETFDRDYRPLVSNCFVMTLVSVIVFWSVFVFDMIADVYGDIWGVISVLIYCFVSIVVTLILHTNREIVEGKVADLVSIVSPSTLSPMSSSSIAESGIEL